ncbi:MAG: type II toxin-antitoxin system RelE/ParE family toxin, partial [Tindallia sp. MSAO_Bac2]
RILEAIEKIPRGDIKKLNGKKLDNIYRLRIGKYRVVYQANEENITIVKVDTRGDVYK